MLVAVPATPDGLRPQVLPALLRAGADVLVLPMLEFDSYHRALRGLWARCAREHLDLCIIEHDIEVGPTTLERFESCANRWCAHSYGVYWGDLARLYGGPWGLGCTRYRWQLIAEHPGLVEEAGEMDLDAAGVGNHRRYSYQVQDSTMNHWLKGPYGERVCEHLPPVAHHHPYNREGAYAPGMVLTP